MRIPLLHRRGHQLVMQSHHKLVWHVRRGAHRICKCWVALTAHGRCVVNVTGGGEGCDNDQTLLHRNVAQELILRGRAELIEHGWLPDAC